VERILDLWNRTLAAVEAQDYSGIDTEIDWAIKKKLIDRFSQRHGLDLDSARISQLDLTYHDISRRRGLFFLLQARGEAARVVQEPEVKSAVDNPPQTTRAKLRGDFVRAAREHGRDFTVDWVHLKLNDRSQQTILCKDPFKNVDDRVEALLASL
jgi:proteasome accessory factor A